MERECGICMDPFDKNSKCPRELMCGHSFCEQCLRELAAGNTSICCPNCRRLTKYVRDVKSLPSHPLSPESELEGSLHNPLVENAHFLLKEVKTLEEGLGDLERYLQGVFQVNESAGDRLKSNYEENFQRLAKTYDTIIQLLTSHRKKMEDVLLDSFLSQQTSLSTQNRLIDSRLSSLGILSKELARLKTEADILVSEGEALKDEQKIRRVKGHYLACSQKLESLMDLKPISKIMLSRLEIHPQHAQSLLKIFTIPPPECELLANRPGVREQRQRLEGRLQTLKRPIFAFFTSPKPNLLAKEQLSIRSAIYTFDVMSERFKTGEHGERMELRVNLELGDFQCIPHPNGYSVFLLGRQELYLYDHTNHLFLQKPFSSQLAGVRWSAVALQDSFIYVMGGVTPESQVLDQCARFSILTERWTPISRMQVARCRASACPINDFQVAVVGGENLRSMSLDSIELYTLQENLWQLASVKLSIPRATPGVVSLEKDRIFVYGGESAGKALKSAEELDFLKHISVRLPESAHSRSQPQVVQINNSVYVFGGYRDRLPPCFGEKFLVPESKWEALEGADSPELAAAINRAPGVLLYE